MLLLLADCQSIGPWSLGMRPVSAEFWFRISQPVSQSVDSVGPSEPKEWRHEGIGVNCCYGIVPNNQKAFVQSS